MKSAIKKQSHRSNFKNKALLDRYVLPTYARLSITPIHGEGVFLWDADGTKYLDFFGGLAVDNLGHCHPQITKVLREQAGHLWHVSNVFNIQEQAELAEKLVRLTGLSKAFFCNSGTEANEAGIKLARHYSLKKYSPDRYEVIALENSFHGRTLGSLSATMQEKYQSGFGPLVSGFNKVPFNNLTALREAVNDKTCAIILEPIQGEGGVHLLDKDYLSAVRSLCDERDILLIADEVQTGIGRTGKLFAFEHAKIKPDILSVSKALGNGFPIGASVVSEKVAMSVVPGIHAATFGGNPLASRVALEVLNVVSKPAFLKRVSTVGDFFISELQKLKKSISLITEVRGQGLMLACELSKPIAREVVLLALEKGLLINGVQGNILRFVPPLVVGKADVKQAVAILSSILKAF